MSARKRLFGGGSGPFDGSGDAASGCIDRRGAGVDRRGAFGDRRSSVIAAPHPETESISLDRLELLFALLTEAQARTFLSRRSAALLEAALEDRSSAQVDVADTPAEDAAPAPQIDGGRADDQAVPAASGAADSAQNAAQPGDLILGGPETDAPPSTRRRNPRRAIRLPAQIVLDNDISTLNAQLIDISRCGAGLRVANSLLLPKYFRLRWKEGCMQDAMAEVVWRHLTGVGVRLRR